MKRFLGAGMTGLGLALLPLVAFAKDPIEATAAATRAVTPPLDFGMTLFVTALSITGLFLVTTLGYLYRRQRGLDWAFQAPAPAHDDHSAAH